MRALREATGDDPYATRISEVGGDAHEPTATRLWAGQCLSPPSKVGETPLGANSSSRAPRSTCQVTIGAGGYGVVSRVFDTSLNHSVALKELKTSLRDYREGRERMEREIDCQSRLRHQGIVPVYSRGHYPDGRPYFVMRLVEGRSLQRVVVDLHRTPQWTGTGHASEELQAVLMRFLFIVETVAYAHSRGVVHRDIKPSNIHFGSYWETYLLDWGLTNAPNLPLNPSEDSSPEELTFQGGLIGTPAYMSPEQARGDVEASRRPTADIYGLGGTLYSVITGKLPREGSIETILHDAMSGHVKRPRDHNRHICPRLEAITLKALRPAPEDRYQTAGELGDDLRRWLAGMPVTAYPESWAGRLWRRIRCLGAA